MRGGSRRWRFIRRTPDQTGSNTGYSRGGIRYCIFWIAYECVRILSQIGFQRRPIAAMTHLAVISSGRSRKTEASGASVAWLESFVVGAVQAAKARAKAAPTASSGRGSPWVLWIAFINAAIAFFRVPLWAGSRCREQHDHTTECL